MDVTLSRTARLMPMNHLTLASGVSLTAEEQRVLKFADWMGVPTKTISIGYDRPLTAMVLPGAAGHKCRLAMSAETLARLHHVSPHGLEHAIQARCATLLVFGCDDPVRHGSALSWLTRGAILGVSAPEHRQNGETVVDLPREGHEFSRQLAGLSFSTGRNLLPPTFDAAVNPASTKAIMRVNRQPVFLRMAMASSEIFLLGGSKVADIDQPLSPETGVETYYDQLIPLLVFLRHSFATTCWHGPQPTAHLIIDDPLLAARYGFLDYQALLSSMHRERYRTSIAFIPWNYRRTSSRTASRLFGCRSDLSICIHGCDHTNKEFDVADEALLKRKADLALERMERHQTRTGLPFERVMVFPQGRFSTSAIRALRDANYLAAVNSTCSPTDHDRNCLRIADCLRPAVTRFHGFPVFHRRYPRRLVDSAFDIFVGKPALLVEHHQYFRDGCADLEEFVIGLRSLEPTLAWPPLSSQFIRSCIMRIASPDSVDIQFYTKRFRLENTHAERRRFRLAKHEPDLSTVRAVSVDGITVPFSSKQDFLEVEVEVDPGETKDIEIIDYPRSSQSARRPGLIYNIGVFGRRSLSEFRDNILARYPRLLQAATGLARNLRATGDVDGTA